MMNRMKSSLNKLPGEEEGSCLRRQRAVVEEGEVLSLMKIRM